MKRILLLLVLPLFLLPSEAKEYTSPRIFWNHFQTINTGFNAAYARVNELQDGRWMVLHGGSVRFSSDQGKTWTSAISIAPTISNINYSSPDFIQLSDGTIVLGLNTRPTEPYSEDRLFGIRVVRSLDNGETWEEPVYVYDAKYEFINGCWEPAFLELPSGELQCYFADESDFTSSSEQCISMCRSFDKGKTWSERTRVSFRAGSRDGMPVPILTDSGDIVVIIEDNGWPGYSGFRATNVRSSLEDNWSETVLADSPNRHIIFEYTDDYSTYSSAAPYLRKHPDGYTIASWMGDHFGRPVRQQSTYDMFVAVGDADARNFKAVTAPFDQSLTQTSQWNSVTVLRDGTILANGNGLSTGELTLAKGYLKTYFEADYGTPTIDGTSIRETYTEKYARQIMLGAKSGYRSRVAADLLYDDKYLYFTAQIYDKNIVKDGEIDNDGYELFFDFENNCTENTLGLPGMFQFYFGANGEIVMKAGSTSMRWNTIEDTSDITYLLNFKSSYYETEVAIPWSLLGYDAPPVNNKIRMDLRIKDFTGTKYNDDLTIPDAIRRQSWSWMELKLNPAPESKIEDVVTDNTDREVLTIVDNSTIHVSCAITNIQSVTLFALNGAVVTQLNDCGSSIAIDAPTTGLYIINVMLDDGRSINRKLICK